MVPCLAKGPGRRPSLSGDTGLCPLRLLSPGPGGGGIPWTRGLQAVLAVEQLVDMKSWSFNWPGAQSAGPPPVGPVGLPRCTELPTLPSL